MEEWQQSEMQLIEPNEDALKTMRYYYELFSLLPNFAKTSIILKHFRTHPFDNFNRWQMEVSG